MYGGVIRGVPVSGILSVRLEFVLNAEKTGKKRCVHGVIVGHRAWIGMNKGIKEPLNFFDNFDNKTQKPPKGLL